MTEPFDLSNAPPSPGAQLTYRDQVYTVEEVRPYVRKDGTPSAIIHWTTACRCGAVIRFTTGLAGHLGDYRRCPVHALMRRRQAIRSARFRPKGWKGKTR